MEATFNSAVDQTPSRSLTASGARWTGRVLSALPVLFLVFDAAMKLAHADAVSEASAQLGFPNQISPLLGVIELAALALYLVPRTAIFGAVLVTGYLGGAIAMHVRVLNPLFSHTLFPIYLAVLLWGGLFLRDARLRAAVGPVR